jgi:hypothetical protein
MLRIPRRARRRPWLRYSAERTRHRRTARPRGRQCPGYRSDVGACKAMLTRTPSSSRPPVTRSRSCARPGNRRASPAEREGVAAQVSIGANFNSPDGSYQGPTTPVGQGQFIATSSHVHAGFVVLPSGWPVLGVGAEATWEDGAPPSFARTLSVLCSSRPDPTRGRSATRRPPEMKALRSGCSAWTSARDDNDGVAMCTTSFFLGSVR